MTPAQLVETATRILERALLRVQHGNGAADDAVHDARIALRRTGALLAVLAAQPNGDNVERAQRALRRLRRLLAGARDADVVLAQFARLPQRDQQPRLERALKKQQRRGGDQVVQQIGRRRKKALKALRRVDLVDEVQNLADARIGPLTQTVLERANHLAHAPSARNTHGLRKALRTLRYALEICEQLGISGVPDAGAFKLAQDALGGAMDAQVMADHVAALSSSDSPLAALLAAEAARDLAAVTRVVRAWDQRQSANVSPAAWTNLA